MPLLIIFFLLFSQINYAAEPLKASIETQSLHKYQHGALKVLSVGEIVTWAWETEKGTEILVESLFEMFQELDCVYPGPNATNFALMNCLHGQGWEFINKTTHRNMLTIYLFRRERGLVE